MTAIIGILCSDGVVIASDSSSTFSAGNIRTIEQPSKKCEVINGDIITCGTGEVGLNQRFQDILITHWDTFRKPHPKSAIAICTSISTTTIMNFQSTGVKTPTYGSVVGFYHNGEFHLCEFAVGSIQPEMKTKSMWWVSMGSGQTITDPFLGFVRKIFWDDKQPNLTAGIYGAIWALEHVISLNPGGIGGDIQMAILSKDKNGKPLPRLLDEQELSEHKEYVHSFEDEIKKCKSNFNNTQTTTPKFV
jgi:20S proteasome alpha/beta subunit